MPESTPQSFVKLPYITGRMKRTLGDVALKDAYAALRKYYGELPFPTKVIESSECYYRRLAAVSYFLFRRRARVLTKAELPEESGLLYVSNHIGSFDQFFIPCLLHNRPLHYLVKEKITHWPVRWHFLYKPTYSIVINQESMESWMQAKAEIIKLLLNGKNVFIFPEGTRRGPDNIGEFSTGVSQIAQEAGVKIVPLAIKNSMHLFYGTPTVCSGKAIRVGERESCKEATARIREEVLAAYCHIVSYESSGEKS